MQLKGQIKSAQMLAMNVGSVGKEWNLCSAKTRVGLPLLV